MRNLFLIVLHFAATICMAQDAKIDSKKQFTINQIDSICKKNGRYLIADGKTSATIEEKSKKNKIIRILNGSGGFSYSLYLHHFNEENYNTLSNIEQRKYNFEKYTNLIKGEYDGGIHYENAYSERIYGEFYYYEALLFYVKIKITRSEDNNKDIVETYNYSSAELSNSKEIQTISFELKSWVDTKNKEIIKYYNRK